MNRLIPLLPALCFLAGCPAQPEDSPEILAHYRGHFSGFCAAWVTSPVTHREYCSSPGWGFNTDAAFAAVEKPSNPDAAFAGFDGKSADDQKALLIAEGGKIFANNCTACHQADAKGVGTTFPPLVGDPVVNGGSADEHVATVLKGLSGKEIAGVMYTGSMTPFASQLTDSQIAAVVTYERNSWGNNGGVVMPAQVAAVRAQ